MEQFIWFTKLIKFGNIVEANISNILRKRKTLENSTIYQSLKSINIGLWFEILETQNINLLDKNYFEGKFYNKFQLSEINEVFSTLYDDFFIRLNNKKAKSNLINSQDKMMLSVKVMVLNECLNTLIFISKNYSRIHNAYKKELQIYKTIENISKNTKFKETNTLLDNINKIKELIETNKLSYERKYSEQMSEKSYSFEKQLIDVEQVLGRSLNVKECNVIQWIEYINKVQDIIKLKEKQNG
jgi:hypothetical protein